MGERGSEDEVGAGRADDLERVETQAGGGGSDIALDNLCLAVWWGGSVQLYELPNFTELTIGRSASCRIRLEDTSVSRTHAVVRTAGRVYIKDAGSANGTRVDSVPIAAHEWSPLEVGAVVSVGPALMLVQSKADFSRARRVLDHVHFEERVEEEQARCERFGGEFGVLRFSVPRRIAGPDVERACAASLRASDILGRWAPHQYAVLLVVADGGQAAAAANRLMDDLSHRLRCAREEIRFAVACYPRDARSPHELLHLADVAASGTGSLASSFDALAGSSEGFLEELARIARSPLGVLLVGETGVGKEVFASRLHELSPRAHRKMIRINCAALTETLLESELFGHEKGAFTGASHSKPGLLETAEGGTVLLDEIGEMPLPTQVKLLRVIEQREVQRIGALEPRRIDARFLTATNRDLEAAVVAGRFRQDLLFRINAITLRIPPLRERPDEIEPLARHFLERVAAQLGTAVPVLTAPALDALKGYSWPGNVRELRNVMERAAVLAGSSSIEPRHLPMDRFRSTVLSAPTLRPPIGPAEPAPPTATEGRATDRFERAEAELEEAEKERIVEALRQCAGNQTHAARLLGISRGTLLSRLDRYGIPRPRKRTRR